MDEETKRLAEEEAAKSADPAEETKTDSDVEDTGIDYKAELEKVKAQYEKRLGQAEHTIIALKKSKKDDSEDDGDDDSDNDIDEKINAIKEEQKNELEKFRIGLIKDNVEDVISSLTSNPDEKELIRFNYENKIVRSGFDRKSIQEDLISAQLLANRSKFEKTIGELKYTLDAEKAKNKGGSATGQDKDTTAVKLTDQEEAWVKQFASRNNLSEDQVRKKLIANKGS